MDLNVLHKVMGASCRRCRRMPLNVRVFFWFDVFGGERTELFLWVTI